MKISVFCPTKFHAFHLAEQLQKHDSLEYLYTSFYGNFGKKRNNYGINIAGEHIRTNLLFAALAYGYNPFSDLWLWQNFGKWAAKQVRDEDIVISWGLSALPIIQKAKERGIITIVERGSAHATAQRDLLIEEYEQYGQPTDTLKRSFSSQRMERELLEYELADYITVPSEFAKRSFIEQGIPDSKLIKCFRGINLKHFRQLPKEDDIFRVIYTGAMSLQKGVHYLLQAFAELNLPNAELWLFGGELPEIMPFFEKYRGHYRHFGSVPQQKLHEYYAHGSVFAICSIQDGFAQVVPQAMACGLPVITTFNTGASDVVEEAVDGFVIPIRDVDAIKEKILYLYENPEICHQMGQVAKRKVQEGLTWDDYGDFIVEKYLAILRTDIV